MLELCAVDFTVRQFLVPLVFHLEDHGCEVFCACTRGPYFEDLTEMGLRMVELPIARNRDIISHIRSIWALCRWIIANKPDVVHVHTPIAAIIGRIAGRLCDVPVLLYTAHGFYFHDLMPRKEWRMHVEIERACCMLQTHLFCVSEEDVQTAIRLGLVLQQDVTYIGNGIDSRKFNPDRPELKEARVRIREELGLPADAQVVTMMGRMVREKGWFDLVEAAKKLAERHDSVHFIFAGDAVTGERESVKEEIQRICSEHPLAGRVHLVGMRTDVPEILAATDLFVLPSYREGLSTSIIEAMMMARPVVAYRIRGCRELVMDGSTGFLVAPGKVDELGSAMDFLIRNPGIGMTMGQAGRKRAVARYEVANVMRREWTAMTQLLSAAR